MDAGTWAEWFAALGTIGAVLAALFIPRWERHHAVKDREHDAEERDEDQARKDLDETRRLLYVALLYAQSSTGVDLYLAGTIVHSLSEHSRRLKVDDAFSLGLAMVGCYVEKSRLRDLIDEICLIRGDDIPDWKD